MEIINNERSYFIVLPVWFFEQQILLVNRWQKSQNHLLKINK